MDIPYLMNLEVQKPAKYKRQYVTETSVKVKIRFMGEVFVPPKLQTTRNRYGGSLFGGTKSFIIAVHDHNIAHITVRSIWKNYQIRMNMMSLKSNSRPIVFS